MEDEKVNNGWCDVKILPEGTVMYIGQGCWAVSENKQWRIIAEVGVTLEHPEGGMHRVSK